MPAADWVAKAAVVANEAVVVASKYGTRFDRVFEDAVGASHPLSAEMSFMSPSGFFAAVVAYLVVVVTVPVVFGLVGFSMKMKPLMRLYNLGMVVLSGYMCAKSIVLASASNNSIFCVPLAKDGPGVEMADLVWIFTFSKLLEFFDTFFMIMEGRTRQISVLHVYHHCSIGKLTANPVLKCTSLSFVRLSEHMLGALASKKGLNE
jgi:GNS1/SUR4 family